MSETNDTNSGLPNSPFREQGGVSELEQQVRRISDKLQHLLRQRETLLKENVKLKEEIRNLRLDHTDHTIRLEQLQQQAEILKASKGEMNEAEKRTLEKRLSQYIREIDRCIALLGE
jgi:chromosome segregation ATPase